DNILITTDEEFDYTFKQPGVLTVASASDGCITATTTYDARFVGVTLGTTGYSSLGCNYALNLSDIDVKAYIVTTSTDKSAHMEQVQTVPEATGLILKGPAGTHRLPIATKSSSLGQANLLHAVINEEGYTVASDDIYVLANKSNGVGFYPCSQGVVVPVGKSYLTMINPAASSRPTYLNFDENSEISGIDVTALYAQPSTLYDLQGRRIATATPRKGLYIKNGKKIIIK
ncbi:MAG: hypothetical protein IJ841_11425, partial [Prevotella sp.]|nr:hypothetical protein [Prevotella sp.]